ncbi:MAG: hypothetical protein WCO86_18490, partial [Planctomycetota bacterium]
MAALSPYGVHDPYATSPLSLLQGKLNVVLLHDTRSSTLQAMVPRLAGHTALVLVPVRQKT